MLDKATKTRIDTARDILVGKVPNPQSQVELITIAMIYKFMDDMDIQNIEMGGNRIFFTDDLEQYAWSKILSPRLNNWERISLYAEALDKLQIAKQIPELFRKIFKDAFLPFRDGATLSLFLNEINGFSYNNSENLGNAFEYLLSIMGSQGDAGQFRTPRHIIDFIVDVVNPDKTDTILDPACGTAGFLISAYTHIIEQTKEAKTPLTPAQHQKLMENIVGYDISPDMVKLASVNLFLHQFPQPKIYEYDTLSSEERWNDKFDIILANPPFMTPKGGIQPHNKFGVKANRAEVLFVDYMMEHLNLKGRAGFVVPEGIIFQSATAYKNLRKMMIEDNYLYAVASLPSGVFNPYSGVKTSVLFFDRELAKQTKDILFVKIDNDGYDLGAQRRPIKDNDLPDAVKLLKLWQRSIVSGTIADELNNSLKATIVSKEKLAENDEYNLSASRYQETQDFSKCQYEMVKLGDVCEVLDSRRKPVSKTDRKSGPYPYYGATGVVDYIDDFLFNERCVLIGEDGAKWGANEKSSFIAEGKYWVNNHCHILKVDNNKIIDIFLVVLLNQIDLNQFISGCVVPKLTQKDLKNIEIPLPPLSVQEDIVKELDAYQAIIDGAQKVIDNWKPTLKINPNWEKVTLEDICFKITDGSHFSPKTTNEGYPYITVKDITSDNKIDFKNCKYICEDDFNLLKNNGCKPSIGDVLFSKDGTVGKTALVEEDIDFVVLSSLAIFSPKKDIVDPKYLFYFVSTDTFIKKAIDNKTGIAIKRVVLRTLKTLSVYVPPLEEQKAIVSQIEREEKYVESCKQLIEIYKNKISAKIKSIWNYDDE